ncbi:hypothetical protein Xclt_18495 [Xanthomonas axonopodis pv. clitoriae]|uniref:Uncharacterized protein n=1 Tax=Xanthomonas axonopodis pv. clitoriae TaxID=487828 RepID=A0AB73PFM2_9XANT|nr:hypothetical protein [Xanthomonas axonopodis]OOW79075.1 hypothetical protein Xclt_18495 [Xanthomonas axonopodis pv. clitoriae]
MFSDVVALYRLAGRPALQGHRFSYQGPITPELSAIIERCKQLSLDFGHFDDGPDVESDEVDFTWALAANDSGRFYRSFDEFLTDCESIHRGDFPSNFYLLDSDFLSNCGEGHEQPPELGRLQSLCEMIQLLKRLSVSGDLAAIPGRPAHLIFVKTASGGLAPETLDLTTRITRQMLYHPALDLGLLKDLLEEDAKGKVRTEEYKALFRLGVADVLATESDIEGRFAALVQRWPKVLERFAYDVQCVVNRLSFDGILRDIADAELNFFGKLNGLVVDNATKFLGIPISLAAIAALVSRQSLTQDLLVCIGALVVALVISGVVKSGRFQLDSTTNAFDELAKRLSGRAKPDGDVAQRINEFKRAYDKRKQFARRVIVAFHVLGWTPIAFAVLIFIASYPPWWLEKICQYCGLFPVP